MVGGHTYLSMTKLAGEGVLQVEARTRCGELAWRPVAVAPVTRFVADDDGIRYTLTDGRDGLPTMLTAFDPARRIVLWKTTGTPSTNPTLEALAAIVKTKFAPAKSPLEPDMSRILMFPLRRAVPDQATTWIERSA
ncbi:MAG: hypothetical protein SNJ67_02185 [Chloracidobacterium sp.]|uniref:Uncharacterized protein n=1 Tax=Chloracidobacterium validum TaxID=2821543 RepID=A0ABX8B6N3_9BACT|nr:hypothetical protein [Chloracidobacterium validum]QUW02329.1 hypothetical protein J8C06_08165 [Chloracidobacterium validum]